ncbi:hypothetical protein TTHERM_02611240 (macronuclear) [Tetrahymena thermophila SB210]|uniref:Transmembrane protein n=1 Tax=Tetrahymena thermophila (strain SB210) TaxID=312017 RepID=Q223U2_TETTS|nr:hypothetical protein TTHERM_02611240 [Tetrahymena thermophila SB210]EAR80558.3 hypothetical protein TTHERM_02611240 [Tetrahymena thermophila SB210]|eukprot:XP_001028221.3 hypothetical protein TTHERM_02611240 [Tetrahymena thermophila SB210]
MNQKFYLESVNYGEIQNIYNTFTECVVCEQDKYSLDIQQCYSCLSGAKCQNGIIYVNQGFWRKDESSPLVIECVNKPSNCIGNTYGNQVCLEGYIGPLCEECDVNTIFQILLQQQIQNQQDSWKLLGRELFQNWNLLMWVMQRSECFIVESNLNSNLDFIFNSTCHKRRLRGINNKCFLSSSEKTLIKEQSKHFLK